MFYILEWESTPIVTLMPKNGLMGNSTTHRGIEASEAKKNNGFTCVVHFKVRDRKNISHYYSARRS